MSEFEIRLTAEAEQNREETMRTLCEAAEEIGKSREQDFQTLKERKWYQRLLKTVTFSNAAEQKKLLIKDVSSLSKLYEITLRALYLLWQDIRSAKMPIKLSDARLRIAQRGVQTKS